MCKVLEYLKGRTLDIPSICRVVDLSHLQGLGTKRPLLEQVVHFRSALPMNVFHILFDPFPSDFVAPS